MYEAPKLVKFGSFRELTLSNGKGLRSKTVVGSDFWVAAGTCTNDPDVPGGPAECRS